MSEEKLHTSDWQNCKNILCVRADNIGDVIMSYPAMRALKQTTGCRLTLLTSTMAKPVVELLPEIDDAIIYDLPWVKKKSQVPADDLSTITKLLASKNFDAAVIFTVYSQNPLPAAMLAYMARIPRVLAYSRENPYELISDWVPDPEPLSIIRHQVQRDLDLVGTIGAAIKDDRLRLQLSDTLKASALKILAAQQVDVNRPWLLLHPGVSEEKRKYPESDWILLGKHLTANGYQVFITGSPSEKVLAEKIALGIGTGAIQLAGQFSFGEFAALISLAPLIISVNTATIHIAAATQTPCIVLYALSNPQHLPWRSNGFYFAYDIPPAKRSRNEIIRFVHDNSQPSDLFSVNDVAEAALELLMDRNAAPPFPQLIPGFEILQKVL